MAMRLKPQKNITLRAVSERAVEIFICLLFLRSIFVDTLGNAFGILGLETTPVSFTYYLCMWICLGFGIFTIIPMFVKNTRLILFVLFSVCLIVMNIMLFPESSSSIYTSFLNDIKAFQPKQLASSMVAVFIGAACTDFDRLLHKMNRAAKIGVALAVLRTILKLFIASKQTYDDMNFAYELAGILCVLGASAIFKQTKFALPYIILGVIILMISGTRGPLLTTLILLVLSYVLSGNSVKKTVIVLIGGVLVFTLVAVGVVNMIAQAAADAAASYGIDLRIADMILDGSIDEGSGRGEILQQYLKFIYESPLLGNGIGFDKTLYRFYPHNIIIELIYNFGIPIGCTCIIALTVLLTKTIAKSSGGLRTITLAFLCASVMKLMFSQTYVTSLSFFLLIGIMLSLKANEITKSGARRLKSNTDQNEQESGHAEEIAAVPQRGGSHESA